MKYDTRTPKTSTGSWLDATPLPVSKLPVTLGFRARRARLLDRELEWSGEVNRASSSYGKWVQSSLNRLIGAKLVVDGVVGAHTRDAVKAFQTSKRLTADGVVGANTEAALLAAGASTPPGSSGTALTPKAPSTASGSAFKDVASLVRLSLAPAQTLVISSNWPSARRNMATIYNRLGGLMNALAANVGTDVASVLAVWSVESGSLAHAVGAAVIRFENHKFYDLWGKANASTFDTYFKFGTRNGQPGKRWENHQFRSSGSTTFSAVHVDQATEYRTLQLAIRLGGDALALQSISIGGPQILVSNYRILGYANPEDMYDAFQQSERWHVLGFFDFCRANGILSHLANQRWTDFAAKYNGPGNAVVYSGKIAAAYTEASKLTLPSPGAGTSYTPPLINPSGGSEPTVTVNSGVRISANAIRILKELLRTAGLRSATVTSGRRDAAEQARVMYNLIAAHSVSYAKDLYGSNGDAVIDVYTAGKAAGNSSDQVKAAMRAKILELGPSNVSHHASETMDVFDVAPSSIANTTAFRNALDAALGAGTISRYVPPPGDPAFHIEIPLLASAGEVSAMLNATPLASAVLLQEAEAAMNEADFDAAEFEAARFRGRHAPSRPATPAHFSKSSAQPRQPNKKAWPAKARPRPRVNWLSGLANTSVTTGPDCSLASSRVQQLAKLLMHLAQTQGSSADLLTDAVRLDTDALINLVPLFVEHGCSRCHLTRLSTSISRLPWGQNAELLNAQSKLLEALRVAEGSAPNTSTECH